MLVIFFRTIIIYVCLVIGLRLMGKRTIGELQPFEFVITLAVADLACTPMQDISIPLLYGLIPLFVMFVLHYFITLATAKSVKFRKFINGKPVIVINRDGIDYTALARLNVNVNDVLESIRSQEYFSVEQIKYAVYETNGNVSLLAREDVAPPDGIPVTLVIEGKIMGENLELAGVTEEAVLSYLRRKDVKRKNVILMTKDGDRIFLQEKGKPYISEEVKLEN